MSDRQSHDKGRPSLGEAALFGLCPKCGAKTLFTGPVRFGACCGNCGLDYSAFNVGDGPAAFLTLIVGGLIAVLAIWLQLAMEPPFWVHIVLWIPLTTLLVMGGLRLSKAALLISEYRNKAREAGRDDMR